MGTDRQRQRKLGQLREKLAGQAAADTTPVDKHRHNLGRLPAELVATA